MKKEFKDNIRKFKGRAFWHWEYQRRNPEYRRWAKELFDLKEQFLTNGICSPEDDKEQKRLLSLVQGLYQKYAPSIYNQIKAEAAKQPLLALTPDTFFEAKFKRLYRDPDEGLEPILALDKMLSNEPLEFTTNRFPDLTALLGVYHQWLLRVDGSAPAHSITYNDNEKAFELSVDTPQLTAHEIRALELLKNASKENSYHFAEGTSGTKADAHCSKVLQKQHIIIGSETQPSFFPIDRDQAESIPKVTEQLKGRNAANEARLIGLWLWDYIDDKDCEDSEIGFKEVYPALVDELEKYDFDSWSQYTVNATRARKHFKKTNECIQTMRVLNLG